MGRVVFDESEWRVELADPSVGIIVDCWDCGASTRFGSDVFVGFDHDEKETT